MRFKLTIGHYPLTVGLVIFLVLVSLFIGLIITLIRTARSDNNVKEAPAGIYVDNSHISIRDTNQVFIRSVTSRVYVSSSSGGGSSGFGGGHSSGSSGVSHGGGGGRF